MNELYNAYPILITVTTVVMLAWIVNAIRGIDGTR